MTFARLSRSVRPVLIRVSHARLKLLAVVMHKIARRVWLMSATARGWWVCSCQHCTAQMGDPGCHPPRLQPVSLCIPFSQPVTHLANLSHLLQWIRPLSYLWEPIVVKAVSWPKGIRAQEDEELTPVHSQEWYLRKPHLNGAVEGNRDTMPL